MDALTYRIDQFEGPLDLLLTLIQKNKVNIEDIPISLICDQYLEYIKAAQSMDMEVAGEFIVMASELMLIKMKNDPAVRADIYAAAEAFKAETINYSRESFVLRLIGDSTKMDEFILLMKDYTILEFCRTGTASLEKGSATLRQTMNL